MTASVLLVCLMLGGVRALVNLDCSDNATCIENLGRDLVKSLREQKAVRLFDLVTIEPLPSRQGRASKGIWEMMQDHALSFDWSDFTFRFTMPKDGRDDALDLELYENRAVKDESEPSPKQSSSKVEDEKGDEIAPKRGIRRRRRHKKKVIQALIPLMFGMKSAGIVIFAFALVTVLTLKAFMASKVALLVTIGMALKRLYETYGTGVGLQNHPYLYSQYPIDFPSASSHAYSVSGVSPQFASNEMYNPNALGSQDFLQQQDASAQQSQQAPLLVNSTHAAERWDGKSKLRKLLDPILDGFKTVINPIANIFYGAMPTFRGLNTEVSTDKSVEEDANEVKKPKEILLPQPRYIAQRKNFVKMTTRPKKYTELKVDLDRLKQNKDFLDYIKTKKYKYNYPNTFYYPRVKYVINPNMYYIKPNNSRLIPYRKPPITTTTPASLSTLSAEASEWKPIAVVYNTTTPQNKTVSSRTNISISTTKKVIKRLLRKKPNLRRRVKRDIGTNEFNEKRGVSSIIIDFLLDLLTSEPVSKILYDADDLAKASVLSKHQPPLYYSITYDALMMTLDVIEGLYGVHELVSDYYFSSSKIKKKKYIKRKWKVANDQNSVTDGLTTEIDKNENNKLEVTANSVTHEEGKVTENIQNTTENTSTTITQPE